MSVSTKQRTHCKDSSAASTASQLSVADTQRLNPLRLQTLNNLLPKGPRTFSRRTPRPIWPKYALAFLVAVSDAAKIGKKTRDCAWPSTRNRKWPNRYEGMLSVHGASRLTTDCMK
eukprot:14479264-Alexandrium_andersonii.AAC.1